MNLKAKLKEEQIEKLKQFIRKEINDNIILKINNCNGDENG